MPDQPDQPDQGTAYTIVATGTCDLPIDLLTQAARTMLGALDFRLVECGWAPDVDTINDATPAGPVTLIDLN